MISREAKLKILQLGMFIMPLVLVKSTGFLLGGQGPAGASAATADLAAATPATTAGRSWQWSDRHHTAGEYLDALAGEPFGKNPMFYSSQMTVDEPAPPPIQETPEAPSLEVRIAAIMGAGDGALALINGRAYRAGDLLDGGPWQIASIDVEALSVRLVNGETGQEQIARIPIQD